MPNTLACEGFSYPPPLPSPGPKARFLPAPLIRARAEAMSPKNCLDLNKVARQALYGILAFFDIKRPTEPVFASRDSICAEALLGSHPTLYRGLAQLVAKGYIRREQGRRFSKVAYGQYSISRIWLEDKALHLLGLVTQKPPGIDSNTAPDSNYPQTPPLKVRDRLQENEHSPKPQLSMKEQPPRNGHHDSNAKQGESSERGIDKKTRLPTELLQLITLGLSRSRVCALMKIARDHGNGGKLGAIVSLVWGRIQKFKSTEAFAYLAKLAKAKKDYRRLLELQGQHEDKHRMPATEIKRLKGKLPAFVERAVGMVVATRAGKILGTFRSGGAESGGYIEGADTNGVRRTLPVNLALVAQWEEGDIVLRHPSSFVGVA